MDDKTINLIVIDDSFDCEQKIVSKLRTIGYTARSTRAEDDEDLMEALGKQVPEIIIYFEGMELISLEQTIECLKRDKATENARVILANKKGMPDVVAAMKAGASDAVNYDNLDHLMLIISREFHSVSDAIRIASYKKSARESEKRCESLLDSSRDAIAYIHEGMHVYSNQSYLEMFDISESDELEGIPILDMVAPDKRDTFKTFLRNYSKDSSENTLETSLHSPNGDEFDGEMELSSAQIEGEPCIQVVIRKNDANSEELERQLKLLSQRDQLTGLFNRQYGIQKLEEVIEDAGKNDSKAALIEIHIDNFEGIKSSTGVVGADKYLIEAAEVLKEPLGDEDVLARYTHDSFAVIAMDYNKDNVESYASKFQAAISQLNTTINDNQINTTCCIGIALIDKDSPEYTEILSRSEKAVQSAIDKGANQLSVYIPEKGELTRQEVDVKFKEQLTDALKNDKFLLHYQPIVSLHGDTDERYEVFVRLETSDEENLVMPQDFLPAAERIGMAIAIDRWVLYRTIQQFCARRDLGKTTRFLIKLSPSSLTDDTLIDWLNYQIKEKQIPANTLNFAIKETAAVTSLKNTKELSNKLKSIKCGVVLDDFGTGTNPFQLLEHVHADYLRIERSYMENLADNAQNQEAIAKLAEKAAELGKFTIAQHVPDAGSLSLLWGMGVNFIQGYFLQEPMPVMEYDFSEMSG